MVIAVEFMILSGQIHPRQGYCDGGDSPLIFQGFCNSHFRYERLVGPDDAASLKYCHTFWKH